MNKQEQEALKQLSEKLDISEEQVFRQALRCYQLLVMSEQVANAFQKALNEFENNLELFKQKIENKESE